MISQAPTDKQTTDQRKLKGQATRERLVIEAINLFGQKGYEGTNTRSLADAAQCNLGLITFHFGGKLGLYNVALTRVKNRLNEFLSPIINTLELNTNNDNVSKKELYKITIKSIDELSRSLLGMEQIAGHGLLLLRDLQDKTEDLNVSYKTVFLPLVSSLEKALDKASSHKDPLRSRLSAFMIVNASLEYLRNYPIFFPEAKAETLSTPKMPYVVGLLTNQLLGSYEDFSMWGSQNK